MILTHAWTSKMCTVSISIINIFVEVQTYKCFDNYLSMVSQLYFGLPILQSGGKGGNRAAEQGNASLNQLLKK